MADKMSTKIPNMKVCEIHGMYPARFDKCPICYDDAVSISRTLTPEQIELAAQASYQRGDLHPEQRR